MSKATVPCPHCGKLNRIDLSRISAGPKCGSCGQSLPLDHPIPVGEADFEKIISGTDVPILADFYADWCGPCRMLAPTLAELARVHAGRVLIIKVDSDKDPALSQRFDVRGLPTVVLFRQGREAGRQMGLVPRGQLEALLGLS